MSRTFTKEELAAKLADHSKWIRGEVGGSRANLSRANLSGANLSGANLYGANLYGANLSGANLSRANLSRANLSGANLSGANLYGANLYGANLSGANLSRANLSRANLYGADLYGADLYGADLSGADLYGANLSRAKNVVVRCAVLPEEGEFICYKKVQGGVVLTLLVPEFAARVTPFSDRKSRVSHATPIRAEKDGKPFGGDVFLSIHDPSFKYTLGQMVEVKDFDGSQDRVCARGIHVYISKAEARAHQ